MKKYIENIHHTDECTKHFMSHFVYGEGLSTEEWTIKDNEIWEQIKNCLQCMEDRDKKCDCPVIRTEWQLAFIRQPLIPERIMPRIDYISDKVIQVTEGFNEPDWFNRYTFEGFDMTTHSMSKEEAFAETMKYAEEYRKTKE